MKPSDLEKFLEFSIRNNFPVLIKGKPGIGKSDIVAQSSRNAKAKLIISHPVVSDPTDYKGLPFAGPDGVAHFMPFGELNELIEAKEKTVFFLDDLGQAPASVQAACMQLILARRINGHKVSDKVTFIAATNRREDKAAVSGILEPVKSRFSSIVELDVDTEDWVKWAIQNDMPVELIAFVRFRPQMIEDFKPTKDIINSPSPRTIANVGKLQNKGLMKSLEFEVIKGAAGEAFASEYIPFLKLYRELPTVDEIILNPKNARIPEDAGAKFAISSALAAKINEQNIEPVIQYLDRLPPELGVSSMKDALVRNANIAKTKSFISWASENSAILM